MIKLNTLLAKVDHSQSMFNRMVGGSTPPTPTPFCVML